MFVALCSELLLLLSYCSSENEMVVLCSTLMILSLSCFPMPNTRDIPVCGKSWPEFATISALYVGACCLLLLERSEENSRYPAGGGRECGRYHELRLVPLLLPSRRGAKLLIAGFNVGRQAQMMPVFSSTADQVAAPTLSQVTSLEFAMTYSE